MKIIDKYLIKQFLQTFFFGIIAFTLIFVIINMLEHLGSFLDQNVSFPVILHYYVVFSPDIIKLMTPVSVLFAALFTAGKAANLSELTAIRSSGVSLYRFMAPFVAATILISIFSVYFSGYIVPMANRTKHNIEMTYLNSDYNFSGTNIFFQDTRTRLVSISFFDQSRNQASRVSIEQFKKNDLTDMISRIDAARLVYDSVSHAWIAHNGVRRTFQGKLQHAEYFKRMTLSDLNFTPAELKTKQEKPEEMNLSELGDLISQIKRAGNDPTSAQIEYYSRFSFPMASLVVVLFGLPISTNKRRGGLAVQIGINILVTFIYLVFMQISLAFGKNGSLSPFLTAWSANIVFLGAAIFTIPRAGQ